MTTRRRWLAVSTATLLTLGLAGTALADEELADEEAVATTMGTVAVEADPDGRSRYYIVREDGTRLELKVGPSWFWGPRNPIDALVGQVVEIGGNANAGPDSDDELGFLADLLDRLRAPRINVKTIDGEPVKGAGKPPWAGGPKVVGEVHPGFEGWSEGQANRPDKPEKPDKAAKVEAKAEAKAAKAAGRAQAKAARGT